MGAFFEPKREAFLLFLVHSLPDYYSLTIKLLQQITYMYSSGLGCLKEYYGHPCDFKSERLQGKSLKGLTSIY